MIEAITSLNNPCAPSIFSVPIQETFRSARKKEFFSLPDLFLVFSCVSAREKRAHFAHLDASTAAACASSSAYRRGGQTRVCLSRGPFLSVQRPEIAVFAFWFNLPRLLFVLLAAIDGNIIGFADALDLSFFLSFFCWRGNLRTIPRVKVCLEEIMFWIRVSEVFGILRTLRTFISLLSGYWADGRFWF